MSFILFPIVGEINDGRARFMFYRHTLEDPRHRLTKTRHESHEILKLAKTLSVKNDALWVVTCGDYDGWRGSVQDVARLRPVIGTAANRVFILFSASRWLTQWKPIRVSGCISFA